MTTVTSRKPCKQSRKAKMTEIDIETRIELLLANYAAMIATLASIERRMNRLQEQVDKWNS